MSLTTNRLAHLAALGTTTVEVKSGYGLSLEQELKALRVIRRVAAELPLTLVPTFLGAHEVPAEYRGRRDAYVRLVIEEMLPAVAAEGLARFCDIFCEPGVFSCDESAAVLGAAQALGLRAKLHADELDPAGGAELAARLGAALGRPPGRGLYRRRRGPGGQRHCRRAPPRHADLSRQGEAGARARPCSMPGRWSRSPPTSIRAAPRPATCR